MTQAILGGHPWDFAIQVFSETHCAGHQLWHTHDPHHPAHRAGEPDLLLEVYRAVDQAIGEIVSAAGPRTTIAVIALHSMSHITGASQLLHDVLVRLGYTTPAAQVAPRDETPLRGGVRRALAGAWRRMPSGIRDLLQPLRRRVRDELVRVEMDLPFDPAASRCFYLDTGFTISSIRLNLRGREPLGIVAPGAEADALVRDLTAALLALENPDTGRPAVRSVRATADVWQGERLAELPDLLVEWDDSVVLGSAVVGEGAAARLRLTSPRTGMLERVNDYCRTGEHRPPGMFIVAGPGIRPGRLAGSRPTLDLAPTFAAMLGTAMPGVDGKAIAELLA
jgi:predicted AlkP superfamily phosphohydrolase/phosphomutase